VATTAIFTITKQICRSVDMIRPRSTYGLRCLEKERSRSGCRLLEWSNIKARPELNGRGLLLLPTSTSLGSPRLGVECATAKHRDPEPEGIEETRRGHGAREGSILNLGVWRCMAGGPLSEPGQDREHDGPIDRRDRGAQERAEDDVARIVDAEIHAGQAHDHSERVEERRE